MWNFRRISAHWAILLCATASIILSGKTHAAVDFRTQVLPIIAEHCLDCHGADKPKAGLDLTHLESATAVLKSKHRAIVPGNANPKVSVLLQRITHSDPKERMPKGEEPLTAAQVSVLTEWIDQGADWPEHWAYQPIVRYDPPRVKKNKNAAQNPIDHFVLAKLEAAGITPSPQADRYTQIKRLYYDLLGLPADPKEADTFAQNQNADAYEKLVDRLLASESFGERWGRRWLDIARYADSDGYEKDNPRHNAWRYRDWVIRSINADQPFDEFTVEQLAGDLIANATDEQKLATAFHRQTLTNTEGGTDQEEWRCEAIFDRIETTTSAWMGLTLICAKCHNHKYDTITQAEYYQLFAFFDNTDEKTMDILISQQAKKQFEQDTAAYKSKLEKLNTELAQAKKKINPGFETWATATRQQLIKSKAKPALTITRTTMSPSNGELKKTLKPLADESLLATNTASLKDNYILFGTVKGEAITGFRIEAMTDDTLPKKGPGRSSGGNFVLSQFLAFAGDSAKLTAKNKLAFKSANADFEQKKFKAANAIDGKNTTGWAISPKMGEPHHIDFILTKPLQAKQAKHVKFQLNQQYGTKHTLGRFRITAITNTLTPSVLASLTTTPEKRTNQQITELRNHYLSSHKTTVPIVARIAKTEAAAPAEPYMNVRVLGLREKDLRTTQILNRGDYRQRTDVVTPGTFAMLPAIQFTGKSPSRLDLANWLMDERHPLTGRVVVNQMWNTLLGKPLVTPIDDFGVRGDPPTHPKLLDWLATEYRRLGWSRKAMIKRIVMSATYRQSSNHRTKLAEIDPNNQLLHRQNRFRVEAETVRDLNLSAAGLLTHQVGGKSVFSPVPDDLLDLAYSNSLKWDTATGADRYRRGMYTFFKRTAADPNLITFDCPDANRSTISRMTSNTPLQALTTLNNEVYAEAAQAMAKRILTEAPASDTQRAQRLIRLCVTRPPQTHETQRLVDYLDQARTWYRDNPSEATSLVGAYAPQGTDITDAAAWTAVARIVMNLDEFITRE